jgi:hypothetical protein
LEKYLLSQERNKRLFTPRYNLQFPVSNSLQEKIMNNQKNGTPNTNVTAYQDCAYVTEQDIKAPSSSKKDQDFPEKLHYVLSEMEKHDLRVIIDRKLFTEQILPK